MMFKKLLLTVSLAVLLSACGDFPDYRFDQSENYCEVAFPFAGGLIGRKYVGYFRIISSLQYLDEDPQMEMVVTEPSHLELEDGSLQRITIADKVYYPKFTNHYFHGELQHFGKAFTLTPQEAKEIYDLLQQGYDLTFFGRLDVGRLYETQIYNFFFNRVDEQFKACVNRLLEPEEIKAIEARNKAP